MKIFGAIGRIGCGKDEVVKYLNAEYDIPIISVGDFVRAMAEDRGIEPSRENLENISAEAIRDHGQEYFMKLALKRIRSSHWKNAGVAGIRTPEDVRFLKRDLGGDFILFHVYVDEPYIRYQRLVRRKRAGDPNNYNDFAEQDRHEEKTFRTEEATSMQDYSLNNSGTLQDLHRQLDAKLKYAVSGRQRFRQQKELNMRPIEGPGTGNPITI